MSLLALLAPLVVSAAASLARADSLDRGELTTFADDFFEVEMARAGIPGAVFVVADAQDVLLAKGYGLADIEGAVTVDPERTVFRVGSISKTITALLALTLVERGQLDLKVDVRRYVGDALLSQASVRPITLFHLLTHTAGFDERLFGQHTLNAADWLPPDAWLRRYPPRSFIEPGQVIAYNDQGTTLAGVVIERATGERFEEAARRWFLAPLRMESSTFEQVELPPRIRSRLARSYREIDGRFVPYPRDFICTTPAAGLFSTGADMGRLLRALLSEGASCEGSPLPAEVFVEARRQQFTNHPLLPGRGFGLAESFERGHRVLRKDGQASGFSARLVLLPDAGLGFFVAINRSIFEVGWSFNRASAIRGRLTRTFVERFLPLDSMGTAPPRDTAGLPPESSFAGTYREVVGSRTTPEKVLLIGQEVQVTAAEADGALRMGAALWRPVEPGVFVASEGSGERRAFGRDSAGRVEHLFIGAGTLERIAWYETARFAVALTAVSLLIFVVGSIAAVSGWRWPKASRRSLGLVVLCAGSHALFVTLFLATFLGRDPQVFFRGLPPLMRLALVFPLVAAVATVALAGVATWSWWTGSAPLRMRLGLSVFVVASVSFLFTLAQWSLLGWPL